MKKLQLYYNQLTGEHFLAQIDRSVYEFTAMLCAKKCVGVSPHSACSVNSPCDASRLRSRCTGQDAFRTLMKQTVPACKVYL